MKHASSLQEEREALLEQIHASRSAYRRMLTQEDTEEYARSVSAANAHNADPSHNFPRSKTVRWIMQHPYLSASLVLGTLALIGPKRISRLASNRGAFMTTLAAAGTMAVRNQPALQKYSKAFSVAAGFLQARRARRMSRGQR